MNFLGFFDAFKGEIQRAAKEQEDIIRLLSVFPTTEYQAWPTYDQFRPFVQVCASQGMSIERIYHLWCAGESLPPHLDAVLRLLAPTWRPVGEIVEGNIAHPLLPMPEGEMGIDPL